MSLLFETIRVAGGKLEHLPYHNARMNRSRLELFGARDLIDLGRAIRIPADLGQGDFRCRVTFRERIHEISFSPHTPKTIRSLTLVDGGGLDYAYKYADRSGIDRLLSGISTDDILIVRDGLVTDASYANIAFFDGAQWLTPASPLLRGTTRERLVDEGRIHPEEIRTADLGRFSMAVLMNAMLGFDLEHPILRGNISPH